MKRQIQQQSILCSYLYNNRKKTKKFLCFKEVFQRIIKIQFIYMRVKEGF